MQGTSVKYAEVCAVAAWHLRARWLSCATAMSSSVIEPKKMARQLWHWSVTEISRKHRKTISTKLVAGSFAGNLSFEWRDPKSFGRNSLEEYHSPPVIEQTCYGKLPLIDDLPQKWRLSIAVFNYQRVWSTAVRLQDTPPPPFWLVGSPFWPRNIEANKPRCAPPSRMAHSGTKLLRSAPAIKHGWPGNPWSIGIVDKTIIEVNWSSGHQTWQGNHPLIESDRGFPSINLHLMCDFPLPCFTTGGYSVGSVNWSLSSLPICLPHVSKHPKIGSSILGLACARNPKI